MNTLLKLLLLYLIRGYQLFLSPLLGRQCRFHPSCSNYTYQAIEQLGIIKGISLGVGRIVRCRPGAKWGYDPVPELDQIDDNTTSDVACRTHNHKS